MSENVLAVEVRDGTGKGVTRKLRRSGRIPAVIYGHGKENVSLTFDPKSLELIMKGSDAGVNTLIGLEGDSVVSGKTVLVKELQRDPVRGRAPRGAGAGHDAAGADIHAGNQGGRRRP